MLILLKSPEGRRMMLNTNLMAGAIEGEKGEGIGITFAGALIQTGETFQALLDEFAAVEPDLGGAPPPAG